MTSYSNPQRYLVHHCSDHLPHRSDHLMLQSALSLPSQEFTQEHPDVEGRSLDLG